MKILIFCLIVFIVNSAKVVDLFGNFTDFDCLKKQGYFHSIIRAYHSYGAIDTQAANTIKASNQAGLSTDVYMFPCRGKNATQQVNQLVTYLDGLRSTPNTKSIYDYQAGTIWLDIQSNPSSGCSWTIGTGASNCLFLKQLINAIESKGRSVGIYASAFMWNQIMGSKDSCSDFSKYPLWYAHYDGKANFDDWPTSMFAGWTVPTMKQFAGDSVFCNYHFDLSYY